MRILAVDTATSSCSVAIADGDRLLSETTLVSRETHSRHLAALIEALTQTAGLSLEQMEGFAVTRGPGSFTGLRIGISTVKGLAVAGSRPMVGVSTLASLAWQVGPTDHMICPMIDARRDEVYAAFYRWHADGPEPVSAEQVAAPEKLVATIEQPCIFIGTGAIAYRNQIVDTAGLRARFVPPSLNSIRAAAVAVLGAHRLSVGDSDDIEQFVPTYLRKSDAELQRNGAKKGSV